MSVSSRLFSILRSQAHSASRVLGDLRGQTRSQGSRPANSGANEEPVSGKAHGRTTRDPNLVAYYANLEIPYGADLTAVNAAWKRQARRYHPDRHATDPERHTIATELLKSINHAHAELCRHLEASNGR